MNRKQSYGTLAGVMFAAALVATLAIVPAMDQQAFAKKPAPADWGDAERLIGVNYIGMPRGVDTDGKCDLNNSNNVYTVRGSGGQHIYWGNTNTNDVEDHCTEAIDRDEAVINVDADSLEAGTVFYTVKMLGKPGGEFKFCKEIVEDFRNGDHCVIGSDPTETFTRENGKPSFGQPKQLFDDKGVDIVWHSQTNDDFRIAHIDVWYIPAA